jgi:hypothetical protein
MKYSAIALTIILSLSLGPCNAKTKDAALGNEDGSATKAAAEKQIPRQTVASEKEDKEKKQWPMPFQPSEKVSADAVISLPTDI